RSICRPSRKRPEITGDKRTTRGTHVEGHGDAAFQDQRSPGRGHRDVTRALRIEIPPNRGAVLLVDLPRLVPPANASVKLRIGIAGRKAREGVRQSNGPGRNVDRVNLV